MGNKQSGNNVANTSSVDGVYVEKQDHFKQIRENLNTSLSVQSFASVSSHQSTYSVSRPWSRVSRRRWKESTLTLPYESSKTAWPVSQLESAFLPEFPVNASYYDKKFDILEEISQGAFGKVYKVVDQESGLTYALKVLSKSKVVKENSVQQVKDEVQIQRLCGHHPFIVNCPLHWQSRKRLYIVSDFVQGGELYDLLKTYVTLPLDLVKLYVAQVALALDFLHNAGVIYRDLKPENVLLDDVGNIQLIDFGLSKWLKYGSKTRTICGTLKYMDRLDRTIKREITGFSQQLRGGECPGMGQISLEFFQKKPRAWFTPECISWEVWTIRLELVSLNNEGERQVYRDKVSELLSDKILYITDVMNRHDYLPKMPSRNELDYIFDTSYEDVQPYLFRINYNFAGPSTSSSVGSTMKKLIKETLAKQF